MKRLLVMAVCLSACTPTNPEAWMEREVNACLPTAIAFRQGLRRQDIWAEVFTYNYYESNRPHGHAMTAYLYPPGKNQLWSYDSEGSLRVRAYTNDVAGIASNSHLVRGHFGRTFNAEWVK